MAPLLRAVTVVLVYLAAAPFVALAQTAPFAPASQNEMAKQLVNPVADLVSVPLQFNDLRYRRHRYVRIPLASAV